MWKYLMVLMGILLIAILALSGCASVERVASKSLTWGDQFNEGILDSVK